MPFGWLLLAGALAGAPAWAGPPAPGDPQAAPSDEAAELRARLAEQEAELARQRARLDALEGQAAAPAVDPAAPVADPAAAAPAEAQPWNVLQAGGFKLRLYGFLRADAIYDDSRMDSIRGPGYVRSEDPDAPASVGAGGKDREALAFHPRATRVGLELEGPALDVLGGLETSGRLEIDFFGGGFSESREALRLRLGYVKLSQGDLALTLGQDWDLIGPLRPSINLAQGILWGAGNVGDRRPQARLDWTPELGPGQLTLQVSAGLSGAINQRDLDAPGTSGAGYLDGETSGLPCLEGRLAYELDLGEGRSLTLGAWGAGEWEHADTAIAGERRFAAWIAGADLKLVAVKDHVWVQAEGWAGANADDFRGGIFQGINTANGRRIRSRGGWVELGLSPCAEYTAIFGYANDDPFDSDLSASGGRRSNQVAYFANRLRFGPLELGLDYEYWATLYRGFSGGRNQRVMSYVALHF